MFFYESEVMPFRVAFFIFDGMVEPDLGFYFGDFTVGAIIGWVSVSL